MRKKKKSPEVLIITVKQSPEVKNIMREGFELNLANLDEAETC